MPYNNNPKEQTLFDFGLSGTRDYLFDYTFLADRTKLGYGASNSLLQMVGSAPTPGYLAAHIFSLRIWVYRSSKYWVFMATSEHWADLWNGDTGSSGHSHRLSRMVLPDPGEGAEPIWMETITSATPDSRWTSASIRSLRVFAADSIDPSHQFLRLRPTADRHLAGTPSSHR